MKVELHPHQKTAVDALANGKVLRGNPGVGKSFTALAYFFTRECGGVLNDWGSMKTPKDIYIITTAKKRNSGDWQKDCYKMGLMEDPAISVGGVRVTVDSWNNIEKYEGVSDAFFIFDESKVAGSGAWSKSFLRITKSNRWILLSATPGDTWLDYLTVFLANGFYKNRTEFKNTHVVYKSWTKFPAVDRYINLGRLVRNRNAVLVEMHYDPHTTRHVEWVTTAHDADLLERVTKKRWHVYENRPLRDVAEMFSVARKVVNSDPSRLEQIRVLQKKHKRLIVFYNFDYELELLRTLGGPDTSRHTHSMTASEPISSTPTENPIRRDQPLGMTSSPSSPTTNDSLRTSSPSSSTSCPEESSTSSPAPEPVERFYSTDGTSREATEVGSGENSNETHSDPFQAKTPHHEKSLKAGSDPSLMISGSGSRSSSAIIPSPGASLQTPDRTSNGAEETTPKSLSDLGSPGPNGLTTGTSPTHHPSDKNSLSSSSNPSDPGTRLGAPFVLAEWNGHKHQPLPTTNEWIYLVQYRAGAEAWNCTTTDAMVFHSQTYSYKDFEQCQGRIDRINTPYDDLWYYVLSSDTWIDKAIRSSLDTKQDFNEARVRHQIEASADIEKIVEMMSNVE